MQTLAIVSKALAIPLWASGAFASWSGAGPRCLAAEGAGFTTGSFARFSTLTSIKEADGTPDALAMVRELMDGHEAVARTARALFPATERAGDEATADLLAERLDLQEKNA